MLSQSTIQHIFSGHGCVCVCITIFQIASSFGMVQCLQMKEKERCKARRVLPPPPPSRYHMHHGRAVCAYLFDLLVIFLSFSCVICKHFYVIFESNFFVSFVLILCVCVLCTVH